jgi:transposase-like protein
MCAWGFTENGERALVSVRLGMRETKEDWIELGRDLGGRGLQAPRLVLSDGAPGYEAAARCLTDDLDALVVHLRYPLRHRNRWQSTNLLERSLGEVRRRTKVMGRFPGETSCLSLVWAVLDLFFSHASNGATFTDLDRQHLYRIKPAGRGIIARRGGERRLSRPRGQPTPDRQPPGCTSARSKPV